MRQQTINELNKLLETIDQLTEKEPEAKPLLDYIQDRLFRIIAKAASGKLPARTFLEFEEEISGILKQFGYEKWSLSFEKNKDGKRVWYVRVDQKDQTKKRYDSDYFFCSEPTQKALIASLHKEIGEDLANCEKALKKKQFGEYQANGGTMTIEEWEADGRFDPSVEEKEEDVSI